MKGRPRLLTPQDDASFEAEAARRAQGLPPSQRTCTKRLAESSGRSVTYVANIIARRRREIEARINVNSPTSDAVAAPTQSRGVTSSLSGNELQLA